MRIACASEHSVGTVSTILAALVGAYRKRLDSGRPPCIGPSGFVFVVFESRWPSTGGRWSAGRVNLFGPEGVVTDRGLDKFLPSLLDYVAGGMSKITCYTQESSLVCVHSPPLTTRNGGAV